MNTPGITVRPLVQMTGDAGFNEVFFDNVRVPRTNLVGELNQGWMVANNTLFHERNLLGSTTRTQLMMQNLIRLARSHQRYGKPAADDPIMRQKLSSLLTRVEAMKYHSYRQLTNAIKGRPPGVGAMVNKLVGTELNHDICALALEIMNSYAPLKKGAAHVINYGTWQYEFMFTLGLVIGGGTSEIQKNIISERGLGMPKSG
jgi:alkylation response protein AidB-like acyl-CoA dehydrogenase